MVQIGAVPPVEAGGHLASRADGISVTPVPDRVHQGLVAVYPASAPLVDEAADSILKEVVRYRCIERVGWVTRIGCNIVHTLVNTVENARGYSPMSRLKSSWLTAVEEICKPVLVAKTTDVRAQWAIGDI